MEKEKKTLKNRNKKRKKLKNKSKNNQKKTLKKIEIKKEKRRIMLKVRNLGKKSLDEVIAKLNSYGLSLMKEED